MKSTTKRYAAYSRASADALFFKSSLYFVAALEVYFVFGSLLASAAVPPCDWKYFVADSLPPTFIIRSWSHCQTVSTSCQSSSKSICIRFVPSRFVDLTNEICTPRLRWLEEQSRHRYIPNGTEDQVGFFVPQSKHTYRRLAEIFGEVSRLDDDDVLYSQASSSAFQKSFAIVL